MPDHLIDARAKELWERLQHSLSHQGLGPEQYLQITGKTEEELKQSGVAYTVGRFPFTANGRSKVYQTTEGFVKVLADAKTDRVLGVHMVGVDAPEILQAIAVAVTMGATKADLDRTFALHPTTAEELVLLR